MIIYHGENLNKIFGSDIASLEAIYAAEGLKPCCRHPIGVEKILLVEKFCKKHNLHVDLSDRYFILKHDKEKGNFSNRIETIDKKLKNSSCFVYISKVKEVAQYAKYLDFSKEGNSYLGKLLGYPDCCVKFYCNYSEIALKNKFDFVLLCKERVNLEKIKNHSFYNNYFLRYFDITLLDHFPCSLDCKDSINISKKRLAFLKEKYPRKAEFTEQALKSFVIYTETNGIFYSSKYRQKDNVINFDCLQATVKSNLFYSLQRSKNLRIVSYDKVIFGGSSLEGEGVGAFIFD